MSPDVKRKYELKVDKGEYKVASDVRDIGDHNVSPLETMLSGIGVATRGGVANPKISEYVSVERNVAEATVTISESVEVTVL